MRRNAIAVAVLALGTIAIPATAYAADHAADAPVNWQARTCQAVAAYGIHPSLRRLESQPLATTLVYDALHIQGRSYFKADAEEFGADQATPSKERDKLMDIAYGNLFYDCHGYGE